MIRSRSARLMAGASLVLLFLAPARAADQPGDLWESTSQPIMEGMPMQMPPRTQKVCTPKVWTQPPPGGDESCRTTEFTRDDEKVSWTVECTGDRKMTGRGEIVFDGPDAYHGEIKISSDEMNMTVKLSGKKIGGCDKPM